MTARFWLAGALALGLSASALAAGDVQITVDLTTNELRATGDGSGNEISIAEGSSLGTYTVTGLNGTTVNGAASDDFDGIRGFVINLAQGNDRVVMSPTLVRGNLRIILGEGADTVSLDGVRVHGRTAIRGGPGSDRVVTDGNCVFRSFLFIGASENDTVEVRNSAFLDRFRIDLGFGDDDLVMENCYYGDNARVEIEARQGDDDLDILDCTFDNDVFVDMGSDDDHVDLEDSNYNEDADISGGGGNDDDLDTDSHNNFHHFPGYHSFEH